MHEQRGKYAPEDDGGKEAFEPNACIQEVGIVENDVTDEEGVDDSAEDTVVAVDLLVGRVEDPSHGIEGF